MAAWTEKWFPDAYIFALAGVVIIAVAALAIGASPQSVADSFGNGFWDLTAFTLQMAMVVLTGYVVATSPPVAKLINRLALIPATARTAVSFVALMSMSVSFLNWGLSLIFGGLLARAIARRKDLTVDYRALGAAAFMGLGAVWALGLSSSAAQLQATAASLPPALLKITGILDFGTTIFTAHPRHPDGPHHRDRALLRAPGRRDPHRRGSGRRPRRRTEQTGTALPPG
jgi:short-chain fatty acids transporter